MGNVRRSPGIYRFKTIYLDTPLVKSIEAIASAQNTTLADLVRKATTRLVEKNKDLLPIFYTMVRKEPGIGLCGPGVGFVADNPLDAFLWFSGTRLCASRGPVFWNGKVYPFRTIRNPTLGLWCCETLVRTIAAHRPEYPEHAPIYQSILTALREATLVKYSVGSKGLTAWLVKNLKAPLPLPVLRVTQASILLLESLADRTGLGKGLPRLRESMRYLDAVMPGLRERAHSAFAYITKTPSLAGQAQSPASVIQA